MLTKSLPLALLVLLMSFAVPSAAQDTTAVSPTGTATAPATTEPGTAAPSTESDEPSSGPISSRSRRETWRGVRAMGMADAFVAGGGGNSAMHHNPAGIGIAPVYSLETGYRRTGAGELNAFGVSLVDGQTNPIFAAGASYAVTFGNGLDAELPGTREQDMRLAIAIAALPERVSIGASMRYVNHLRGVDAELESLETRYTGLLWDFGLVAALSENLSIGASINNLGSVQDLDVPRLFRGGAAAFFGPVHIEAEYEGDMTFQDGWTNSFAGGLEVVFDTTPVRVGYRWDGVREGHVLATGVGVRAERGGLDLGFQIDPTESAFWELGVSFSGYF